MSESTRPPKRPHRPQLLGVAILAILFVTVALAAGWFLLGSNDSKRLHQLTDRGDVRGMSELLDREPGRVNQRNRTDMTPLHLAAYRGQVAALDELLRRGADVNARWNRVSSDDGEWTALHIAAVRGDADSARALLRAKADVNARTKLGLTALDMAALYHHEEFCAVLSAAGGVRAVEQPGAAP